MRRMNTLVAGHAARFVWMVRCGLGRMVSVAMAVCLVGSMGSTLAASAPSALSAAAPAVVVQLLSQYDYPPFHTGGPDGLTVALAHYLTAQSKGAYLFQAEILPRKRLDIYLADPDRVWVVPWAVPRFFGDEAMSRYVWSAPVMWDGNVLLSPRGRPVRYRGPESLDGLRLGGTLGHRYGPLEPLIAAGRILREDCNDLICNVRRLALGRVDFAWVPSGALAHLRQQVPDFDATIDVSPQWVESFERRLMLQPGQVELNAFLQAAAKRMASDPAWTQRTGSSSKRP